MLILYRRDTGEVVDNSGVNALLPCGPEGDDAFVNVDRQSISRAELGELRLHDEEDADLVAACLAQRHHVEDEQVVLDGPYEPQPAEPEPDPDQVLLDALEGATTIAAIRSALADQARARLAQRGVEA